MQNKVKVTLTLEDTYLDLKYYKVQIKYWDKEEVSKSNQPYFKLGSLVIKVLDDLDNLNQHLDIEIKVKNNPTDLTLLENISGQKELKESKLKSAITLTESVRDANRLKEYIRCENVWFS